MTDRVIRITIDPNGATAGANQTNQALNSIGTNANGMANQVSGANSRVTSSMQGASQAAAGLQSRLSAVGASAFKAGGLMSLGLTAPIIAMGKAAVAEATEARKAIGQVEAALASMGPVAGRTSKQLQDAANSFEANSMYEADEILTKVTANLLTFGNVAKEQFDRAQQAAIDMATRMGSDPQGAAIMLGKALNDPVQGITALTRVGVQFTEAQKKQIEGFMKVGNAAAAQNIMLIVVEK